MGCDGFAILKVLELLICIACVILKRVTDYEALNVFFRLQKLSREWPFLNNITWEQNGSTFADITYGGFVIITAGLLLGYVMGELRRARKMEVFFLLLGVIMFGIMGGLVLAALEAVPPELVDNAAALGVISLIAALLFILDLVIAPKRPGKYKPPVHQNTQTLETSTTVDLIPIEVEHKVTQTNGFVRSDQKNHGEVIHELRSSLKGSKTSVGGPNMYGESPDLTRGQKGVNGEISNEGYQNGGFNIVENGERINMDAPKFEKMGDRKISDSTVEGRKFSDQFEKQESRNLERFKKTSTGRSKKAYSSGGSDYDFDDFLHLPTVSFLLAERGDMQRRRSLESKSAERIGGKGGTQMLSMMPVMSEENGDYFRRSRSIDQLVQKEDLERERRDLQNQREQFAKERELYLFNSRKYKETQAGRNTDYNRKMHDSSPDVPDGYYRNMASTTPEPGIQRKKSVTIRDLKSPELADEVQTKLSQQGFVKVGDIDSKRTKNVGFTKYDYDDDKYQERKHVGTGTESPTPELIAIQKKAVSPDHERMGYNGTPTPDYDRPNGKSLIRRLDSNASDHWRYDSRDANRNFQDDRHNPSTPSDPGFVMHAAHNWPDVSPKTPSQSPSEKAQYRTSSDEDYRPVYNPPTDQPPSVPAKTRNGRASEFRLETPQRVADDYPSGGSLTTQLLQKWLKQRHSKVEKIRSNP